MKNCGCYIQTFKHQSKALNNARIITQYRSESLEQGAPRNKELCTGRAWSLLFVFKNKRNESEKEVIFTIGGF